MKPTVALILTILTFVAWPVLCGTELCQASVDACCEPVEVLGEHDCCDACEGKFLRSEEAPNIVFQSITRPGVDADPEIFHNSQPVTVTNRDTPQLPYPPSRSPLQS